MKYAAIVLRNITTPTEAVDFTAVTGALLSGGIPLEEVALLPYDNPPLVRRALKRLADECEGVFLICDRVLLSAAREAVSEVSGKPLTAYIAETERCLFAVLPAGEKGGEIVRSDVVPAVDRRRRQSYQSIVIKTVSAPPDLLLSAVAEAQDEAGEKLVIHMREEYGVGRIEIIYDRDTPKVVADEVVRILVMRLEKYVYAMEDIDVGKRLFEALKLHRMKVATAESFTAGGVGQAIVSNPGASKVFYEGLNTYDSASKMERLGVSAYTLRNKGAVSGDTAYEMAAGLLKDGHCDLAIATTGVAGPGADLSGAPAGLCFIAIGTKERVRVFEFHLEGDREEITKKAVNLALFLAYKEIN